MKRYSLLFLGLVVSCIGPLKKKPLAYDKNPLFAAERSPQKSLYPQAFQAYRSGDYQEAEKVLEKDLTLNPDAVPSMLLLAKIYLLYGVSQDSREHLHKAKEWFYKAQQNGCTEKYVSELMLYLENM
jgi:TolA-binding protein